MDQELTFVKRVSNKHTLAPVGRERDHAKVFHFLPNIVPQWTVHTGKVTSLTRPTRLLMAMRGVCSRARTTQKEVLVADKGGHVPGASYGHPELEQISVHEGVPAGAIAQW